MGDTLGLARSQLIPSLHVMEPESAHQRLLTGDTSPGQGFDLLRERMAGAEDEVVLLEGPGNLNEGLLYGLSLIQLARGVERPRGDRPCLAGQPQC